MIFWLPEDVPKVPVAVPYVVPSVFALVLKWKVNVNVALLE